MKNKIKTLFIIILLIVGLNGCIQNQIDGTKKFTERLDLINEDLFITFFNINNFFNDYTNEYNWYKIIGKTSYKMSMINDMDEIKSTIELQLQNIESYIENYYSLKNNANLNELKVIENNTKNEIEYKILKYNNNKDLIENCTKNMGKYRDYVYSYILKIIKLTDYEKNFSLLNIEIENENFEDAKIYLNQIIKIMEELKVIEYYMSNLSIIKIDEEFLDIWDLYIEVWDLYGEYIDLRISGNTTDADIKYDEYSKKFDLILEISSKEDEIKNNDDISKWFNNNIGSFPDLIN